MDSDTIAIARIDSVETFLTNLWSIFPALVAGDVSERTFGSVASKAVLQPQLSNSIDFCEFLASGKIFIKSHAKGGVGTVGFPKVRSDDRKSDSSRPRPLEVATFTYTKWDTFERGSERVILKSFNDPSSTITWELEPDTLHSSAILHFKDPLSEAVFGGMVSHLFDMGAAPFAAKYYGFAQCGSNPSDNRGAFLMEAADVELFRAIRPDEPLHRRFVKDPDTLLSLIMQYAYQHCCMKTFLGLSHLDTHLRNVMLKKKSDFSYRGERLAGKELIQYHVPLEYSPDGTPTFVFTKFSEHLVKIIDFGLCVADLSRSKEATYRQRIALAPSKADSTIMVLPHSTVHGVVRSERDLIQRIIGNAAYANTFDFYFTILHLYQTLTVNFRREFSGDTRTYFAPTILALNTFCQHFFGTEKMRPDRYLAANPQASVERDGATHWKPVTKFTGVEGEGAENWRDPGEYFRGMMRVCEARGHVIRTPDGKTIYYLEPDIPSILSRVSSDAIFALDGSGRTLARTRNAFYHFVRSSKLEFETCRSGSFNASECARARVQKLVSDPNVKQPFPILPTNGILETAILSRSGKNVVDRGELLKVLEGKILPLENRFRLVATARIDVAGSGNIPDYLKYSDYSLHGAVGSTPKVLDIGITLWTANDTKMGGRLLQWDTNVANALALERDVVMSKVGIESGAQVMGGKANSLWGFAYPTGSSGTYVPLPREYWETAAVLTVSASGIAVYPYEQFLRFHSIETVPLSVRRSATSSAISSTQDIRLADGIPMLAGGLPISDSDYFAAITIGPVVLAKGNPTVTPSRLGEILSDSDGPYSIVPGESFPVYKFARRPGEADPTGFRSFNATDDLCLFVTSGIYRGFIVVSGGIDYFQAAEICKRIGCETAIVVNRGPDLDLWSGKSITRYRGLESGKILIVGWNSGARSAEVPPPFAARNEEAMDI